MKSELPNACLQEVLAFSNGRTSTVRNEKLTIPVYGANGLIGMAAEANSPPNTIIIGRVGSYCGSVHFSKTSCWITDNAIKAIAKESNDPLFLYYLLKHLNLNTWRSGSGQPLINQAILNSIPIFAPLPVQQRSISSTLGALDDRITLLRETNTTLEAIAQALFKSWFIDFDPVHAKIQGQAPQCMDEATATLFPDSFEESELGPIPKGWSLGTLADISTLNPDAWTTKSQPKKILYLDLANVKQNIISQISVFDFVDAPSRARRVLRDGDSIIGTVRPGNRSFAFIAEPIENLTGSTGFAVLRPKIKINTEFLYLAATNNASIDHLQHIADGGAYPAVRPEKVIQLNCTLPTNSIMEKFCELTNNLLKKISTDQKEIYTLSKIRDSLLPKLISGEINLKNAN